VFLEEFRESRDRDIEGIVAIMQMGAVEFGLGGNTSRFLEVIEKRLGLSIDRVCERFEGVVRGIVEESTFLEEEGNIGFASSLESC
jgi:hypothetical protein